MKLALILVSCVVAAGLVVAAIGALLPRSHVATRRMTVSASPEVVFAILRDFAAAAGWRTGVKSVEMLPPREGRISFRETSRHGAITYVVDEAIPNVRLTTRIADESLPFGGTWTFEVRAISTGTEVRLTERGEVKNVVFRFLARFVFGYTKTIETYLNDLGRKLGEPVEVKG